MKCPICNKNLENSKDALDEHLKTIHMNYSNPKNFLNISSNPNISNKNSFLDFVTPVK